VLSTSDTEVLLWCRGHEAPGNHDARIAAWAEPAILGDAIKDKPVAFQVKS
jgi:hypothetical protein